MKFPLTDRPFESVELSDDQCRQYQALTEHVVAATLEEHNRFVAADARVMDKKLWKAVKNREDVTVYKQIERKLHDAAPVRMRQPAESCQWRLPKMVAVGTIAGSVDDVMYGVVTPDAPTIAVKTSYVNDELLDSAVLQRIESATTEDPFRFLGVKWMVMGHSAAMSTVVWPRDFVFVESTGTKELSDGSGGRVGFHVVHSIDLPQCGELTTRGIVRARLSNCYLFRQLQAGVVEIYMMTYGEPGGSPPETIAITSAAATLIGIWKSVWCAQNKKLAWLLENNSARRRFRAEHGVAAIPSLDPVNKRSCKICEKVYGSFRMSVKTCQFCSAYVCTRCCVARKLSFSDETLQLTQRLVEVCKSCVGQVTATDARQIAREQYVLHGKCDRVHVGISYGTQRSYSAPEEATDPTPYDGLTALNPRRQKSESYPAEVAASEVEPVAVETIDDWATQSGLARSVHRPATTVARAASVDGQQSLLQQMQSLCLTAEETYAITSLTASRIRENSFATAVEQSQFK